MRPDGCLILAPGSHCRTGSTTRNRGRAQEVYEAFGSASIYGLALVASVVLLALSVMRSPEPLNLRWWSADLWRRVVRSSQARSRRARIRMSRFRRRIDLLLVNMLEQRQSRSEPGQAYQSKHRLPGPAKESQDQESHKRRPAPRHAAPPTG